MKLKKILKPIMSSLRRLWWRIARFWNDFHGGKRQWAPVYIERYRQRGNFAQPAAKTDFLISLLLWLISFLLLWFGARMVFD